MYIDRDISDFETNNDRNYAIKQLCILNDGIKIKKIAIKNADGYSILC